MAPSAARRKHVRRVLATREAASRSKMAAMRTPRGSKRLLLLLVCLQRTKARRRRRNDDRDDASEDQRAHPQASAAADDVRWCDARVFAVPSPPLRLPVYLNLPAAPEPVRVTFEVPAGGRVAAAAEAFAARTGFRAENAPGVALPLKRTPLAVQRCKNYLEGGPRFAEVRSAQVTRSTRTSSRRSR